MRRLIVITGPNGSGKSALARLLSRREGYAIYNLGDILLSQLHGHGIDVDQREDIGRLFLAAFGLSGYCEAVEKVADDGIVIDGLRLMAGLSCLRNRFPTLLHVFRPGHNSPDLSLEEFGADLITLNAEADITIPWLPRLNDLSARVDALSASAVFTCSAQ